MQLKATRFAETDFFKQTAFGLFELNQLTLKLRSFSSSDDIRSTSVTLQPCTQLVNVLCVQLIHVSNILLQSYFSPRQNPVTHIDLNSQAGTVDQNLRVI